MRLGKSALVWGLCAVLAVSLIASALLAWRVIALSNRVDNLSALFVSATTTTTTPLTTLPETATVVSTVTTADPWRGGYKAYVSLAATQTAAIQAWHGHRLGVTGPEAARAQADASQAYLFAQAVNELPFSPLSVRQAQDDYVDALMKVYAAGLAYTSDGSTDNRAAYYEALGNELLLSERWQRAVEDAAP